MKIKNEAMMKEVIANAKLAGANFCEACGREYNGLDESNGYPFVEHICGGETKEKIDDFSKLTLSDNEEFDRHFNCKEIKKPLMCPHGRMPIGEVDGWHYCPHCLGVNEQPKEIKFKPLVIKDGIADV